MRYNELSEIVTSVAIAIPLNQNHSNGQNPYIKKGLRNIFKKNHTMRVFLYDFVSHFDCKIEFAKNVAIKKVAEREMIVIYWTDRLKKFHSAHKKRINVGLNITHNIDNRIHNMSQKDRLSETYFFTCIVSLSQIALEISTEIQDHIQNQRAIMRKKTGKLILIAARASVEWSQA
jgi:hypothetical protein